MNKKISVITVVYNDVTNIETTIKSILNQIDVSLELIIIDGGSTDGTLDIISKYSDSVDIFISEKDNGIYDAMNKGIEYVTGEWVIFMNSGDTFVTNKTLSSLNLDKLQNADIVYGSSYYIYQWGRILIRPAVPLKFTKTLPFVHQSVLVKSSLMKKNKFDCKYKVCADLNFFFSVYNLGAIFQYIDIPISNYKVGGYSSKSGILMYDESNHILGKDKRFYYKLSRSIFYFRIQLKHCLPNVLVAFIQRIINTRFR